MVVDSEHEICRIPVVYRCGAPDVIGVMEERQYRLVPNDVNRGVRMALFQLNKGWKKEERIANPARFYD